MAGSTRISYVLCIVLGLWAQNGWGGYLDTLRDAIDTLRSFLPGSSTSNETPLTAQPDEMSAELLLLEAEAQKEKERASAVQFALMGDYAVADWLNSINISSFLDLGSKCVLNHDPCFVFFDFCENVSLWVEPYLFYSHYGSHLKGGREMDFTLGSYGASLGAKWVIISRLNLGGGVGYFYSNLHDESVERKAKINGIYFGPTIQYLFPEGSAQLSLFGVKNYYDGPSSSSDQSWDLNWRLEGEYDYTPPSEFYLTNLIIHPFARIDYTNVFEESPDRSASFFYSKLGVRFDKVAYCGQVVVLTVNVDAGWVNMSSLSGKSVEWEDLSVDVRPYSKNQLALGVKFIGMHQNGVLACLEYDAALGSHAPMQTGRVRAEWSW